MALTLCGAMVLVRNKATFKTKYNFLMSSETSQSESLSDQYKTKAANPFILLCINESYVRTYD